MSGWLGIDLDGTLIKQGGPEEGQPVPLMVERVRGLLARGVDVRIVTARYARGVVQVEEIERWCLETFGRALPITDRKDFEMVEIWDDRAVQVQRNTGKLLGRSEFV